MELVIVLGNSVGKLAKATFEVVACVPVGISKNFPSKTRDFLRDFSNFDLSYKN